MSKPPSKTRQRESRPDSRSDDYNQPFTRDNERGQTQSMLARIHLSKLILFFIGLVRASLTSLCYRGHLLRNRHLTKKTTKKEKQRNHLLKRAMMTFANSCSSRQSRMFIQLHFLGSIHFTFHNCISATFPELPLVFKLRQE